MEPNRKPPNTIEEFDSIVFNNELFTSLISQVPEEQREEVKKAMREYAHEFYNKFYLQLLKPT